MGRGISEVAGEGFLEVVVALVEGAHRIRLGDLEMGILYEGSGMMRLCIIMAMAMATLEEHLLGKGNGNGTGYEAMISTRGTNTAYLDSMDDKVCS